MLLKYFDENSSVQLKFELDLSNVTEVVRPKGLSASVKFNKVSFSYGRLMYSHDTSFV